MRQLASVVLVVGFLLVPVVGLLAQDVRSEPPPGLVFDFGRWPYPLNDEMGEDLRRLAAQYPRLARVHQIGESRRGRPLWVIELTNIDTGPGETKPGMWMDGNIHAGELTGRPYLQYFAHRLLYSYGKDELSTRMLDTRTFYVMPVFDADGGDLILSRHPAWPGYDPDEQRGDDLDGDGFITRIRTADTESDDGYRYYMESRDVVERGRPAFLQRRRRDPLSGRREGADFNRNWSAEWNAAEPGAGPRPVSLPEVSAAADFILGHDHLFFT